MNEAQAPSPATHLEKVLASATFQGAGRSGALLRFLVDRTLQGRGEELKEYTLGAEALGRGEAFDPRFDSIARVEASRLRSRLELYYATEGQADRMRIGLPKGGYKVNFEVPVVEPTRLYPWKRAILLTFAVAAVAMGVAWKTLGARATISTGNAVARTTAVTRLEVDLGPGASLRSSQVGSSSVIVSPDGRRLVFLSFRADGVPRLFTRRLDQVGSSETVELRETEGARGPFFSPDSKWVAFLAGGKLKKVQVDGGVPITVCESDDLLGGTWGKDDTIIAAFTTAGLWRVPAGGARQPLPGFPMGVPARWPQLLPDGEAVLYTEGMPGLQGISAFSISNHKVTKILEGATYGRYLTSGHLAFVEQGTLFVAPFDADQLKITGARVQMLSDVAFAQGFDSAEFDASADGALVYRRDATQGRYVMRWLSPSGETAPFLETPGVYTWPRFSPDGTELVFTRGGGAERTLEAYDWQTGRTAQLSDGKGFVGSTIWTPDGRFLVTANPKGELQWLRADGVGGTHLLKESENELRVPWSFNAAGDRLAFYQRGSEAGGTVTFDLWTVPIRRAGDTLQAGTPEPYLISDAFETYPMFSPDGRWIAYTSLESGTYEVYVRAFPDNGRKWLVSSGGGQHPHWFGNQLFYRSLDQHIMVADFAITAGSFRSQKPRQWSKATLAQTGVVPGFDMDGKGRVVALFPAPRIGEEQDERHVTMILNFLDEVKRRAPIGGR